MSFVRPKAIAVPGYDLPPSSLLSDSALKTIQAFTENKQVWQADIRDQCSPVKGKPNRLAEADSYYRSALYQNFTRRYNVAVTTQVIAGVTTEHVVPSNLDAMNANKVLINCHGGAFVGGSRTMSRAESIPIAAHGGLKVISIDYRMAPEYQFPAATEDVVKVYRALLEQYPADCIGLYGCSAGALLTAQSLARFQAEGLPLPAAVGLFYCGAYYWGDGDSGSMVRGLLSYPLGDLADYPYFAGLDRSDPTVFPGHSDRLMEAFPPSLLISATRDFALSSVVHTHSRLVQAGVEAELHIWEGLDHVFQYDPELSESRDAYECTADFFRRQLCLEPLDSAI